MADVVVFYPTANVHFQVIGWDSIEQAILFEWRAMSASQDRARVNGMLGRTCRPAISRLFLVLTRMSPPQKHVCVLEARKAGERRWDERSQHSYHFFFFLIIAIITGIPSRSLCGGERRGALERET